MLKKIFQILEYEILRKLNKLKKIDYFLNQNSLKKTINFYKNILSLAFDDKQTEVIFIKNNEKKDLKVSVITSVFNRREYIKELALSIQNQTFSKYIEWVVVDDNSTDGSLETLLELAKNLDIGNVVILRNKKNLGVGYSLKVAVENSSCDILAFCESDDFYISANKIENDYNILKNDNKGIVFSKYILRGPNSNNIVSKISIDNIVKNNTFYGNSFSNIDELSRSSLKIFIATFFSNFLNASSVVLNKNLYYLAGGFDPYIYNLDQDWDLFSRILIFNVNVYFSSTTVFYRLHSNQLTNRKDLITISLGYSLSRIRIIEFLFFINFKNLGLVIEDLIKSIEYINNKLPKNKFMYLFVEIFKNYKLSYRFGTFFYFFVYLLNKVGKLEYLEDRKLINFVKSDIFKEIIELSNLFSKTPVFSIFKENFQSTIK
jgi:glycosyltransferase involved in cell wall biosynthesis